MPHEQGSPEYLEGLLRRCRTGDEAAWCELVRQFQALVFTTARTRGLGREEAEDVMQITFVALYKSLDTILAPSALPRWLFVTASREADRRKSEIHRSSKNETEDLSDELPDDSPIASEASIDQVRAIHVRTALAELPGPCRDLLTALYSPPTLSYKEVSERFKIPIGSIGPTRARCLDRLRRALLKSGYF